MSTIPENTWVVVKGLSPVFRENVRYVTKHEYSKYFYDDGVKSLLEPSPSCHYSNYEPLTVSQLEDLDNQIEEYYNSKNKMSETKAPQHYDNSKGSLYQFAEDHELNSYEFDICKRIIRSRKKGNFREDLEKTKFLIDLYLQEQGHLYETKTTKN